MATATLFPGSGKIDSHLEERDVMLNPRDKLFQKNDGEDVPGALPPALIAD